jgi:cob(I)alamin adenosyltransferase
LSRRGAYGGCVVKQPFVNLEEKIDRFVGRRTKTADSLEAGMQLQAAAVEFHRAFKHRWAPKGVYRFKTHEEADQWMMKMLARADQNKT